MDYPSKAKKERSKNINKKFIIEIYLLIINVELEKKEKFAIL